MAARRRYQFGGLLLLAALGVATWWVLSPREEDRAVYAVPHTVSDVPHPYDPDWPDVYMIVANKCLGCHRENNPEELADFSTYDKLIAAKDWEDEPLIKPGNAEDSVFFQKVLWNVHAVKDCDHADEPEMPPEREEWLTAGQLEILRRWINHGALQYKLPDHCSPAPLMEHDFPSARVCKSCHPNQYEDWSRSMHAYAQHSPAFEAFNLTLVERTGGTIGTFCTRCHTPIGTALGENGSARNVNRSRISREGITCIVCHRRSTARYKASGRVTVEPGKATDVCMYGPFEDSGKSKEHGGHDSAKLPYIKSAQFCGECHDVTSPVGVRLEEAFSEWQNSPAAKAGITCQHCHMGPVQGVPIADDQRPLGCAAVVPGVDPKEMPVRRLTDHTFAGPDYSLLPDTEFPEKLDWMYEVDYRNIESLTPYQQKTLEELRRRNRKQLRIADQKRYELLMNAAKIDVETPQRAAAGSKTHVCVDVTSKTAGHSFPTGFTAERQLWVSVFVRDPQGKVVFASGDLDLNRDLRDEHSHEVLSGKVPHDRHLLNFQNKFMALSHKGTDRSVVISVNRNLAPLNVMRPATGISASFGRPAGFRIAKGSLPPLATVGKSYPVRLPKTPGVYTYRVRLNFRHLPPTLLDHIGTPHLKHLLEVVVIDEKEGVIVVE